MGFKLEQIQRRAGVFKSYRNMRRVWACFITASEVSVE